MYYVLLLDTPKMIIFINRLIYTLYLLKLFINFYLIFISSTYLSKYFFYNISGTAPVYIG